MYQGRSTSRNIVVPKAVAGGFMLLASGTLLTVNKHMFAIQYSINQETTVAVSFKSIAITEFSPASENSDSSMITNW